MKNKYKVTLEGRISKLEREREMTIQDFCAFLDTFKDYIKGSNIEEGLENIFNTYIGGLRNLNKELNYLKDIKNEAEN